MAIAGKYGLGQTFFLYLACGAKKVGTCIVVDAAGYADILLEEPSSASIGEAIIRGVC